MRGARGPLSAPPRRRGPKGENAEARRWAATSQRDASSPSSFNRPTSVGTVYAATNWHDPSEKGARSTLYRRLQASRHMFNGRVGAKWLKRNLFRFWLIWQPWSSRVNLLTAGPLLSTCFFFFFCSHLRSLEQLLPAARPRMSPPCKVSIFKTPWIRKKHSGLDQVHISPVNFFTFSNKTNSFKKFFPEI